MVEQQVSHESDLLELSLDVLEGYLAILHAYYSADLKMHPPKDRAGAQKTLLELRSLSGNKVHDEIPDQRQVEVIGNAMIQLTTRMKLKFPVSRYPEIHETIERVFKCMDEMRSHMRTDISEEPGGMSRRSFLKAVLALTVGSAVRALDVEKMAPLRINEEDGLSEFERNIQYIHQVYGLEILTGIPLSTSLLVSGENLSLLELEAAVKNLRTILAAYPRDFFKDNHISTINLTKNLRILSSGKHATGLRSNFGFIFIAIGGMNNETGEYQPYNMSTTVHHEIYHAADVGGDPVTFLVNSVYQSPRRNQAWKDIYNCGCDPYQEGSVPRGSFLREYAASNVYEHKATVAEYLMQPSRHKELLQQLDGETTDPKIREILKAQIEMIKMDYLDWSGGLMDEQYWLDLMNERVDESYFSKRRKS